MKRTKIISLLLAFALIFSLLAIQASAEDWTLSDGSFENWGICGESEEWESYVLGGTKNASVIQDEAHSGKYSVKLTSAAGRVGLYQNIGIVPTDTTLKISAYIKIKFCGGSGVRLIARHGSVDGAALCYTGFSPSTDNEWKLFTMTGTVTNSNDLYIEVMTENNTLDCELYIDDFVVEETVPTIANPGFDSADQSGNSYTGWNNALNATQTSCVFSEGTNNVLAFTAQGYVTQSIPVKANTKYRISYDIKTNGPVGLVKFEWDGGKKSMVSPSYNTGGEWVREMLEVTPTTQNIGILLRYVGASGYTVYYDNISIEKIVNDGQIVPNGSFEFGANGASGFSITNGTGTMTAVKDSHSGNNGMQLTSAQGVNVALGRNAQFDVTESTLYEFSTFAKLKDAYHGSYVMLYVSGSATGDPRCVANFTDIPLDKWTKISFAFSVPSTSSANVWLRIIGGGSVVFDDFSIKPLKEGVSLSEGDGTYTESFTSKSMKISEYILPKVTEGIEKVTTFAAVYKKDGDGMFLTSVSNIVNSDVPAGGSAKAVLSLSAPDDFVPGTGQYFIKLFTWNSLDNIIPKKNTVIIR